MVTVVVQTVPEAQLAAELSKTLSLAVHVTSKVSSASTSVSPQMPIADISWVVSPLLMGCLNTPPA